MARPTVRRRALLGALPALAAAPASSQQQKPPAPALPTKRDWRTDPFRVAVALGESTTAGGTATARERTWVSRLARLINEAQIQSVKMLNHGIGANMISTRSAHYEESGKPSAMERYEKHVIAHKPDLVFISYGLNDARAGTPVGQFIEDLRHVVLDVKARTGAVVVIVNAYFMTGFDRYDPFRHGSVVSFMGYNAAEQRLAQECDVLYADAWDAEGMAPWVIDPDGVHANDLGHQLIANRVFEVLAKNCSCLAERAREARKGFKPWRDESVLKKLY